MSNRNKHLKYNNFAPFTAKKTRLRYVQPAVRQPIKPFASYQRPEIPINSTTVYNTSFIDIDQRTANQCRMPPIKPDSSLSTDGNVPMERDSVMKSSYPPIKSGKTPIVMPFDRITVGQGPMQEMTTQKHDFCPKRIKQRESFRPNDAMQRSDMPIDNETTMSCSFQKPTGFVPSKSFKPDSSYHKPKIPMESNTCNKLSYLTHETKLREIPPWAQKANFQIPIIPMETVTMNASSYAAPGAFILDTDVIPELLPKDSDDFDNYPKATNFD